MRLSHALLVIFLGISFKSMAQTATLTLSGKIENDKMYVQNPASATHDGFCSKSVSVNGKKVDIKVNQSDFEIDLGELGYKKGDSVTVQIVHEKNCKPRVLKSFKGEVKTPLFEMASISVDTNGNLTWTTKNENYPLMFNVEQYRWNKWIRVAQVQGKGTKGKNTYECKVDLHSGENKFRVKQTMPDNTKPCLSPNTTCITVRKKPTFKRVKTDLVFSSETMYELYDGFGSIVKKGKGARVDLKGLKKGNYFINFDNYTEKFALK